MTNLVTRIRRSAAQRAAYRQIVDELANLSPRDLADIGIAPANIRDIAHASVYGK